MVTRWDVAWTDVAYEDIDKSKRRPVLILNGTIAYTIVAKMTSQEKSHHLDYELIDWQSAGLQKPTIVKLGKKFKFDKDTIFIPIGKLSKIDIDNIKDICKKNNISLTKLEDIQEKRYMKLIKESISFNNFTADTDSVSIKINGLSKEKILNKVSYLKPNDIKKVEVFVRKIIEDEPTLDSEIFLDVNDELDLIYLGEIENALELSDGKNAKLTDKGKKEILELLNELFGE